MTVHETVIAEEDFSSLPLSTKLVHKNWKARVQGYDELYQKWKYIDSFSDLEWKKYSDFLKSLLADTNAAALDAAYAPVLVFIFHAEIAIRSRKELLPLIIEKGLMATKSTTKVKALEALLAFVYIDSPDPVVDELIQFFDNKQPKLVASVIAALFEIIKAFGIPPTQCKKLLKEMPKIFSHADKFVRIEANRLTVEIYRWIRTAIFPFIETIKPVQLKELHEQFGNVSTEAAMPEKYLKSREGIKTNLSPLSESSESQAGGSIDLVRLGESSEASDGANIDPYDLAEPFEILSKIPKNFDELIGSPNWKERKEGLESVLSILKVVRIAEGKYGELVSQISKKLTDANISIVILAASCIEALARGLRSFFHPYQSMVVASLLERLKEKKTTIVESLRSALDALFDCSFQITEFFDATITALNHKNPQVKSETLQWISRSLKKQKKILNKSDVTSLSDPILKCFDDGDTQVRESAFVAFAALLKMVGLRMLGSTVDKIDKLKMEKVNEYVGQIEHMSCQSSLATSHLSPTSSTPLTATRGSSKPSAMNNGSLASVKETEKSALYGKKHPSSLSASTNIGAKKVQSKLISSQTTKADSPAIFSWSDEQAVDHIELLLTGNLSSELVDLNWKTRLEAIDLFGQQLESSLANEHPEALTRFLLRKPGFRDCNLQVCAKMIDCLKKILLQGIGGSNNTSSSIKASATVIIPGLIDKLSEVKLKSQIFDLLNRLSELITPSFIIGVLFDPLLNHKNPKCLMEILKWIQQSIIDFGVLGMKINDLFNVLKSVLGHSNAQVRNGAVACLITLRIFSGSDFKIGLSDLSSGLLSTIETEFSKVGSQAPPKPTKFVKGLEVVRAVKKDNGGQDIVENDGMQVVASSETRLEDTSLRVDISTFLKQDLLQGIGDSNWKIRKESMDRVITIIEDARGHIDSNGIIELMTELKGRLSDSNKNLIAQSLDIMALLTSSCGKSFEKLIKPFLLPAVATLADSKVQVRQSALKFLDVTANLSSVSLNIIISDLAEILNSSESPLLRKDLLSWFTSRLKPEIPVTTISSIREPSIIVAVASCLPDRNAEVRKAAQLSIQSLANLLNCSFIYQTIKENKPSLIEIVQSTVDSGSSSFAVSASTSNEEPKLVESMINNKPLHKYPPSNSKSISLKAPTSTASLTVSSTPSAVSMCPIVLTPHSSTTKLQRSEKDKGHYKFVFDLFSSSLSTSSAGSSSSNSSPGNYYGRKDLVDATKDALDPYVVKQILIGLFSDDFKEQLGALSILDEFLSIYAPNDGSESTELEEKIPFDTVAKLLLSASDLYFKYLAIRFVDSTNTTLILKCLDILEKFCVVMDKADYQWLEYEASVITPYLIHKLGDSKEVIRCRVKFFFPYVSRLYPSSKLISNYMLDALIKSGSGKNIRLKTEIIEEIIAMIERGGGNILILLSPANKLLSTMAMLYFSEKDGAVRQLALKILINAVNEMSEKENNVEDILKACGKLGTKEIAQLEERLRKEKKPNAKTIEPGVSNSTPIRSGPKNVKISTPFISNSKSVDRKESNFVQKSSDYTNSPSRSSNPFSLELDKLNLPTLSQRSVKHMESIDDSVVKLTENSNPAHFNHNNGFNERDLMMDVILANIASDNISQSAQGLDLLDAKLPKWETYSLSNSPLDARESLITSHASKIVTVLTQRLGMCFTAMDLSLKATDTADSSFTNMATLAMSIINSLLTLVLNKSIAATFQKDSLFIMLPIVGKGLVNENFSQIPSDKEQLAMQTVTKNLNILLIKILEYCDRNHIYSVLLDILKRYSSKLIFRYDEFSKEDQKLTELIMKCLWRLTRSLQDNLVISKSLHLRYLLRDLHEFLLEVQPFEWKRRIDHPILSDMPLRTVKTILHELTMALGERVLEEAKDAIGDGWESNMVTGYLKFMLERKQKSTTTTPFNIPEEKTINPSLKSIPTPIITLNIESLKPLSQSLSMDSMKQPDSLTEAELNERLDSIFQLIADKDTSKQGIVALYDFREAYPQSIEIIESFLSRVGGFFCSYIHRNLSMIGDERKLEHVTRRLSGSFNLSPKTASISSPDSYKVKLDKMTQLFDQQKQDTDLMPLNDSLSEKENGSGFLSNLIYDSSNSDIANLKETNFVQDNLSSKSTSNHMLSSVNSLKERLARIKEVN